MDEESFFYNAQYGYHFSCLDHFPFTSLRNPHTNGILYGINTINNSLAIVDRFLFENANEVVFGKSGPEDLSLVGG